MLWLIFMAVIVYWPYFIQGWWESATAEGVQYSYCYINLKDNLWDSSLRMFLMLTDSKLGHWDSNDGVQRGYRWSLWICCLSQCSPYTFCEVTLRSSPVYILTPSLLRPEVHHVFMNWWFLKCLVIKSNTPSSSVVDCTVYFKNTTSYKLQCQTSMEGVGSGSVTFGAMKLTRTSRW